jgi:predicted dehydrogenase
MKIVLAGTSHWHAAMHCDAARACGAEVAAVWDEDPVHATRFARRHGLQAVQVFDEVLALAPDLVVIMGHPGAVPARAQSLIEAGLAMMLEKPAAPCTAALSALRNLVRQRGTFVAVPFPNRFGPTVAKLNQLREEGRAGHIAHAHFRIVNGPPSRYAADGVQWVVEPAIAGGGALRNLGIHGVDAALSLAEGTFAIRSAFIGNRIHAEAAVEDHALLVLEDGAGALFTVEAGYTFASRKPGGDFEWRIASANATLIDQGDRAHCATLDDGLVVDLAPEPPATRYRLCMHDALHRVVQKAPPAISLDDYVAAMALIDAAYEKAKR